MMNTQPSVQRLLRISTWQQQDNTPSGTRDSMAWGLHGDRPTPLA